MNRSFSSYPSFENARSIDTPLDVPNTKKGNEHILLTFIVSRRSLLRRIKLRKATSYIIE